MRRDVFQAIADPIRRDIIELLASEPLPVSTIAKRFDISRPAISKHIRILKECGLIKIDPQGRENYCIIEAKNLIPAFIWLDQYRQIWEEKLDSFESYLMELKSNTKKVNLMNDAKNRTLTIDRTFNAPIQLVWQAWTEADHIAKWWGPKGMATTIIQHDFQVGGKWKYSMLMPDKNEFIGEGKYSEIIELKKIVTSADFRPMTDGVTLEVLLKENGNQTNFTFNVVHQTLEYCKQQEEMGFYNGWGSTFARLSDYLEKK